MDVTEFIDTYSDDLIYLHQGRTALLEHPTMRPIPQWVNASFCRMLAVFVVGSIEAMLTSWRDQDRIDVLRNYFAKNVSNIERVSSLYQAFRDAGLQVDKEVFDDYLAVKYLRNTIIHGAWREHEKEWLEARQFPADTRELTKAHLERIERVNQNMMLYVFLTSQTERDAPKPQKLIKLEETIVGHMDSTGILRLRDLDRIIWINLERIDAHIYAAIEKAVTSGPYTWTGGRSRGEIEALDHEERKRLFYITARRAGEDNYGALAELRPLAREALQFWREYWERAVSARGLSDASIQSALKVLESADFHPEMPLWDAVSIGPDDAVRMIVDPLMKGTEPFTNVELINALRSGKLAYDLFDNVSAVTLLSLRLPIIDPENTAEYLAEAARALRAFRLNRVWYWCVEKHSRFIDEPLAFYAQIQEELSARALAGSCARGASSSA